MSIRILSRQDRLNALQEQRHHVVVKLQDMLAGRVPSTQEDQDALVEQIRAYREQIYTIKTAPTDRITIISGTSRKVTD